MREDWQTGYVETNGLRLHYTRAGGNKPPIVLAHGVTDAGPCWTPVAEALAADYDPIMVDARGHGRSDAPEHEYGPAAQAEDLAGVITSSAPVAAQGRSSSATSPSIPSLLST